MLTKETTSTLTSDLDSLPGRYGSQGRRLSLLLRPRSSCAVRVFAYVFVYVPAAHTCKCVCECAHGCVCRLHQQPFMRPRNPYRDTHPLHPRTHTHLLGGLVALGSRGVGRLPLVLLLFLLLLWCGSDKHSGGVRSRCTLFSKAG